MLEREGGGREKTPTCLWNQEKVNDELSPRQAFLYSAFVTLIKIYPLYYSLFFQDWFYDTALTLTDEESCQMKHTKSVE